MSDAVFDVPFVGGPDDQTDPRLMPPGSVVSALNQVYDLDGSYQPRYGYQQIGGAELLSIRRFAVFSDELLAVDGAKAWTFDAQGSKWAVKDNVPAPGITHRPLFNTSSNFEAWNEAVADGYRVVAWIDGVDATNPLVRAAVYSVETGAMILGPVQISASARQTTDVQVAAVGTKVVIAWVDVISPSVLCSVIDVSNIGGGFIAAFTISNVSHALIDGGQGFTLCASATLFFLAYETAPSGGTHIGQLVTMSYNATAGLGGPITLVNSTLTSVAAHYYGLVSLSSAAQDGGDYWLVASAYGYVTDSVTTVPTVWLMRYNPATLIKSAGPIDSGSGHVTSNIVRTGVDIDTSTTGRCVVVFSGTIVATATFYNWYTTAGAVGALQQANEVVQACTPVYSAELNQTFVYVYSPTVYFGVLGQRWGSYYCLSLGSASTPTRDLVAILAPRIVNAPLSLTAWLPTPRAFFSSATAFEVLLPIIRNTGRQGLDMFTGDLRAAFRWSPCSLGKEDYLSGQVYDSNLVSEIGYSNTPFVSTVTSTGSGSFTGTWQYVVTYGRVNAQGDIEESAPSIPFTVTATSKAQFNIIASMLELTQKQRASYGTATGSPTPVFLIVYRTTELGANGASLHYRVFNEPFPAALLNDPNATAPLTIVDTTTDAALTDGTHPVLYTDSGELPHNCPETFTHCIAHKNRIWGIGADQRTIWYSQVYADGDVPSYNELQTLTVDDTAEPLIALASLYDKLLVFTATRIYIVYGDGPAITGAGNDLTTPQRIPSPSGCLDPRSVVNTPMGIMFQGIMGLMLVDAGLGVTFIGKNITRALASTPICTSAYWCEDTSTVRFTMLNNENSVSPGLIALFDVRRSRWAVHQLSMPWGPHPVGAGPQSAAWHPSFGYVAGHNTAFGPNTCLTYREGTLEDAAPWLDLGTNFVSLSVTTAWIKGPDGNGTSAQGSRRYRRIRSLGQFYNQHALTVTIGYDYAAPSEAHTYSSDQVASYVVGAREQVRIIPQYGKGEAIQVTLATSAPNPISGTYTGQGCGLTGLQFEIHDRKGGYRNMGAGAKS